jgi:hypothetical protein
LLHDGDFALEQPIGGFVSLPERCRLLVGMRHHRFHRAENVGKALTQPRAIGVGNLEECRLQRPEARFCRVVCGSNMLRFKTDKYFRSSQKTLACGRGYCALLQVLQVSQRLTEIFIGLRPMEINRGLCPLFGRANPLLQLVDSTGVVCSPVPYTMAYPPLTLSV